MITINGKTISQALTVKMKPFNKDATALIPSTASPVLKTMLTIKIEAAFPYEVDNVDEWTVNMTLLELSK